MAYFRKRSGAWEASITKKGFERTSRTFDTKSEAEAWAAVVESEMARGIFVSRQESEKTTLSEALDRYEKEISSSKKGYNQERKRISQWKRHPLAIRFLASIRGADLAQYRDEKIAEGYAANTVRLNLAIISHLFEIARKEWGMEGLANPVKSIRVPPPPKGRDRRLLPGEEKILLEACDTYGGDMPPIVRLALETGMRRGEIASMTWEMVNIKKRTITLPETKNGEKRIVPLSREAVRILSALPRRIDGNVWGMTQDAITRAFLLILKRGRETYEKTCKEEGAKSDPKLLTDITFHDLRHEATSRFFEKGLNPMQVSAITGHKTLQMLRRYTHLKAEDLALMLDG